MATKISLKQLGEDVLKLIGKGGNISLEKDIISNVVCGAAPSGTLFKEGQTFTEFAEKLLRKDITPTISTSFSGVGLKEVGTTVNGIIMNLCITNLNSVTVPINEVRFYVNNSLVNSQTFIQEQQNYQYIYSNEISENTSAKAELVYNTDQKVSGSGSFTFVYASYYGATTLSSISDVEASSLAALFIKSIKNTKSLTWENIILDDERFCYMYPSSFGLLTSIKDGNGFSQLEGYTKVTVNLTSPINGDIVPYYVYFLADSVTGSGFKQIYG
jgi:hypothetical protein